MNPNLSMLSETARGLAELKDQVVFVGGATVELYITDPAAAPIRATDDVDCVIEITSRLQYADLEEKLRALGFEHPLGEAGAPICRRRFKGIAVDVMPTDRGVLGFSNRWYPGGISSAIRADLPDGQKISIFTLPYFIASKLQAFDGRGKGDYMGSSDLEDIVAVIDGNPEAVDQMAAAPADVKNYCSGWLREKLLDDAFQECISGHVGALGGGDRSDRVLDAMRKIAEMNEPRKPEGGGK